MNGLKQSKIPTITVNASSALSTISNVQSRLNGLKDVNRTILYRYRTVGSPPAGVRRAQHGFSGDKDVVRTTNLTV
ncbi:hypothetical protein BH18THE2_BH18THE2_32040 [soil metagenome]